VPHRLCRNPSRRQHARSDDATLQVEGDVVVTALLSGQRDEGHVQAAIEAVRSSCAIKAALAEARAHARQSQEALSALPENGSRHTLHALAQFAVDRRR